MRKSDPQWVSLELPMGADPNVHCPICGGQVLGPDESGVCEINVCPHLVFVHVGMANKFEYQSEEFMQRMSTVDEYDELNDDLREFVRALEYDERLLALEITTSGMACGPVSSTDVFAFDYGLVESEAESGVPS